MSTDGRSQLKCQGRALTTSISSLSVICSRLFGTFSRQKVFDDFLVFLSFVANEARIDVDSLVMPLQAERAREEHVANVAPEMDRDSMTVVGKLQ